MGTKPETLEFDEIVFFEKVVERKPDYFQALSSLAEAYTAKGLYQQGLAVDQRLAKLFPEEPLVQYNLACSYALTGQKESAIHSLQLAVRFGYRDFTYLKKDRDLKSLHQEPAFKALFIQKRKTKSKRGGPPCP